MDKTQYNSSSRLINVAARLLNRELQDSLHDNQLNISVEQWRILFYLWDEDGISQREIAKKAYKEKSTITRQIDALETKGLIVRQNKISDKRNKLIYLTESGKKMEDVALGTAQKATKKAENNISEKDISTFKDVLTQIITNIQN